MDRQLSSLIIEVRVNEYAMRDENPAVPWTPREIADDASACRAAGASIVHFHGRANDGAPDHRFEVYRDAMLAIRESSDILIHPTLGYVNLDASAEERLSNVMRLAADPRTRPDFAPMDMGSTNVDWYEPETPRFRTEGLIYKNGTDTLAYFARSIADAGMTPALVMWNVSFVRQMNAFLDIGLLKDPCWVSLLMTEGISVAAHPATERGLTAYLDFLPGDRRILWAACNGSGSILPLLDKIITSGGHIQLGLGDHHYAEIGRPSNAELIHRISERARELGRKVATPAEVKRALNMANG